MKRKRKKHSKRQEKGNNPRKEKKNTTRESRSGRTFCDLHIQGNESDGLRDDDFEAGREIRFS